MAAISREIVIDVPTARDVVRQAGKKPSPQAS